jgi:hypothetical protein
MRDIAAMYFHFIIFIFAFDYFRRRAMIFSFIFSRCRHAAHYAADYLCRRHCHLFRCHAIFATLLSFHFHCFRHYYIFIIAFIIDY